MPDLAIPRMARLAADVSQERSDTTLAAMAGDQAAIVRLLQLAQPDIRRLAARQCRTSSDADDAVQEVLWLLYRRVGMLRAAHAFHAWLFTMVRRTCLRLAKSALPNHVPWADLADDERLSTRPLAELRIDLAAALASLPSHYRQVVLLRDIEEMTIDEIGEALALSRESVKGRLHRARALLREYLVD